MTQLRPLIIIAVLANLLTLISYNYTASQTGGSGASMIFVFPWMAAIWLAAIIATIVIIINKRKLLFQKPLFGGRY